MNFARLQIGDDPKNCTVLTVEFRRGDARLPWHVKTETFVDGFGDVISTLKFSTSQPAFECVGELVPGMLDEALAFLDTDEPNCTGSQP